MKCSDVLRVMGRYDALIQAGYGVPSNYKKSGIMKVGNVTMKHVDHWDFRRYVGGLYPRVDKQGREYLFINLFDER